MRMLNKNKCAGKNLLHRFTICGSRFIALYDQLTSTGVDEAWLNEIESRDNVFPDVDWNYWR